ncbi:MAG: hypothetical protein RJB15_1002, partial [Pseudomonadota bacterium]
KPIQNTTTSTFYSAGNDIISSNGKFIARKESNMNYAYFDIDNVTDVTNLQYVFELALTKQSCIGFAYVLAGGIQSEAIKANPIADLYGWKSAGHKASELTQATKAQGIAVQNWTLGSRAAWYAKPTPVFVLDERRDQFDLWFGDLPQGANILLINWSGMSFPAPIGSKNSFERCEPLDSLEIKRFGQILSKFDFSLCNNWQGSSLAK